MRRLTLLAFFAAAGCPAGTSTPDMSRSQPADTTPALRHAKEIRLAQVRQLTRGERENAEAYWSFGGTQLIFQSNRKPHGCDQIFTMPVDGSAKPALVSTGTGRTTCAYYLPGDEKILWSSTHLADEACPPNPDRSQGYVWALYEGYDIFVSNPDGGELQQLTKTPGYDAEATVCRVDGSIVFTSMRDGDLELYRMNADGSGVNRLTHTPGYDGGAFFDASCENIVWRASRPTGDELVEYQRLLKQGLVRPSKLELFVANADGTDARQVTYLDAASFGPFFMPSGDRIVFSTNYGSPRGREFDIYAVNVDGSGLERITYAPGFDGFPIFSPDGASFVFGSNRNQANDGETDVYIAKWIEDPPLTDITPGAVDRFMADVRWLADDARGGRGIGTVGLAASADWLEQRMTDIGLATQRQAFGVVVSVKAGDGTAVVVDGKPVAQGRSVPSAISANGSVEAKVVWVNYGITAADLKLDDYKRVKAKGNIVAVRRFSPKDGVFEDEQLQRRYSDVHYKAWNAREHGAVGLIVVDLPVGKAMPQEAPLPALVVNRHGDAGIPVVVVGRDVGVRLSRGRHRAKLAVNLVTATEKAHNIIGRLEAGAADKLDGVVVIGAHYDHLGLGGENSFAPDVTGVPHNGADDNASGTAALLEVARQLVSVRDTLRRDVVFVGFSAEESGILGSNQFTKHPPKGIELNQVVAMLNMDMVGRMRNNQLQIIGGASAVEWDEVVSPVCAEQRVQCSLGGDGYGPSDQTPFYAAGAPVLHFFTGAHPEYHKPSDDTRRINGAGGAAVARIVARVAARIASREQRLTYKSASAPGPQGDVRSYGASLGTIPDYAGAQGGEPGVRLTGVRKHGPADRAGVRRGDRIVKLGTHEIRNIRDMMQVLRMSKPDEKTTITVVRDGKNVELEVTYGKSRRRR